MEIWCVEDEQNIRSIVLYTLQSTGFSARGFENAAELEQALKTQKPDLILLDIMLPETDGMQILERLRQNPDTSSIPVIMTTAKGLEFDKIEALEAGADDYLVKPFGMMEMVARIKAVLRRCAKEPASPILESGEILLDLQSRRAVICGEPAELTRKEFELLKLFLSHPDKVFTRDELFTLVWGEDFIGESRTVDVHIGSLRTKLKEQAERIETVRGIGYRLRRPS